MILFLIQRYITFRFNHLLSYFATLYSRFSTEIVGTLLSFRKIFLCFVCKHLGLYMFPIHKSNSSYYSIFDAVNFISPQNELTCSTKLTALAHEVNFVNEKINTCRFGEDYIKLTVNRKERNSCVRLNTCLCIVDYSLYGKAVK